VAAGAYPDAVAAIDRMSRLSAEQKPSGGKTSAIHDAKYKVFLALQQADHAARGLVAAAL
jgi:D-ribulokinase